MTSRPLKMTIGLASTAKPRVNSLEVRSDEQRRTAVDFPESHQHSGGHSALFRNPKDLGKCMGGIGSGASGFRRIAEQSHRIDIGDFRRRGYLKGPSFFTWRWSVGGECSG